MLLLGAILFVLALTSAVAIWAEPPHWPPQPDRDRDLDMRRRRLPR